MQFLVVEKAKRAKEEENLKSYYSTSATMVILE